MFLRSALLLYLITALLPTEGRKYTKSEELQEIEDFEEWRRFRRERKVIQERESRYGSVEGTNYEFKNENPPPIDKVALMGRYIVNQADWTSVATISSREETNSFPFVNIISFSDGPLGNGSGIPYLFLTPLDFTAQDISKDHRATLMMTLAQGHYCSANVWDPMDPRCARIMLSGEIKPVKNGSAEYEYAKNAVFTRHPKLVNMPADHRFFFAKLDIGTIAVLDTFGGASDVAVQDYLYPSTADVDREFFRHFSIRRPSVTEIKGDDHYVDTNTL